MGFILQRNVHVSPVLKFAQPEQILPHVMSMPRSDLPGLKERVVRALASSEAYLSPTEFDMKNHNLIHLVEQMIALDEHQCWAQRSSLVERKNLLCAVCLAFTCLAELVCLWLCSVDRGIHVNQGMSGHANIECSVGSTSDTSQHNQPVREIRHSLATTNAT